MKKIVPALILITFNLFACNSIDTLIKDSEKDSASTRDSATVANTKPATEKPRPVKYRFIQKKEWQALKDSFEGINHIDILNAINRVDETHLKRLDSILVPDDYGRPLTDYLPFPTTVASLKNVNKIILFSYPAQVFAAYQNGDLVRTGPTSMGRKNKPTPRRLYFTNWKAKKTISTVDDAWILKWNFNVHNTWGVGFHEYALPGYPASHSCMRLLETDAMFLYNWAEQWRLQHNKIIGYGTPVVVFGEYPFGEVRPWYQLTENPAALNIAADSLTQYVQPYFEEIMNKQEQRIALTGTD